MKKTIFTTALVAAVWASGAIRSGGLSAADGENATVPPVVLNELKVLGETYRLLDVVADRVWPGWTGYREWPFLFTFDNGVRVLVGHPNPPKEFQVVADLTIGGSQVVIDRTRETSLPLKGPFSAGGGLIPFGSRADGTRVDIIDIRLTMPPPAATTAADKPDLSLATERKVLVYLHELFHGFQRQFAARPVGNLMYNADVDYAAWSNIEGLALERAYAEATPAGTKERIREFLVARALKRGSMTDMQQRQESSDDQMEGTATYAMVRALEVVKAAGFRPSLDSAKYPDYRGFAAADPLIDEYRKRLREAASTHENPKMKCYEYGCFQGLLAERVVPGWQARVQKGEYIDAVLASALPMSDAERAAIEQRLRTDYPVAAVRADAAKYIEARDTAWNQIRARRGRTYVIDLKGTGSYPPPPPQSATKYRMGLVTLFPSGFPGLKLDEIELSRTDVPALTDQIYYVKVVDTDAAAHKTAYTVTGTRLPDGTYARAVVTTPLFTLKAPKVRIRETGSRVKIQVLARVAGKTGT